MQCAFPEKHVRFLRGGRLEVKAEVRLKIHRHDGVPERAQKVDVGHRRSPAALDIKVDSGQVRVEDRGSLVSS